MNSKKCNDKNINGHITWSNSRMVPLRITSKTKNMKSKGLRPFKVRPSITNRDSKSVSCYFNELNKSSSSPMSKEEEIDAFKKYKAGCQLSRQKIINSNLRFVISVAKQYDNGNPCLQLGDLISLGNIGMLKAIEKYDADSGNKFISYAIWYIRQSIISEMKNTSSKIRIPQNARIIQSKQERFIDEYYSKNGFIPSEMEISEALGTDEKNIRLLNKALYTKSLDAPISTIDGASNLSELIPNDDKKLINLFDNESAEILNNLLSILTEMEQYAIKSHFGLNGKIEKTLNTMATEKSRTVEGFRQILRRALRKLNTHVNSRDNELINFL